MAYYGSIRGLGGILTFRQPAPQAETVRRGSVVRGKTRVNYKLLIIID